MSCSRCPAPGGVPAVNLETVLSFRLDYAAFVAVVFLALLAAELWTRKRRHTAGLGAGCWMFVVVALMVGAGATEYFGDRQFEQRRNMLVGVAPTYARELESLGHARLSSLAAPDDPLYLNLIQSQIRWLKANPNVADIYTFRKEGDRVFLMVDSETDYDHNRMYDTRLEQRTPIGFYYQPTDGILKAFTGVPSFDSVPVTDEWGTWVSAFEPMFDAQGNVEAVLGVDYPAATWLNSALLARLCAMGGLLILITIVAAAAVVVSMQAAALEAQEAIEAQVREARDAAEAASRSKSAFLANMSHEIRTPMTAILGFTDLLLEDQLEPALRFEHLTAVKRNGEHLLSIINDILDISKIEAGKMTLEAVPTDPARILEDTLAAMRPRATGKNITLESRFDTPIPRSFACDPVRLRQILLNLVGNAVKFTHAGSVTVHVSFEAGVLRFAVQDTGIGISPDQMSRLFQAFSQADSTMTRRFGGTGLGLAISERLASMLGGTITASSEPGRGTTFTLSLQVPDSNVQLVESVTQPAIIRAPASSESYPLAGMRILLAEDGPDNQRLISFHLTKAGASVTIVDNGRKAVQALTIAADTTSPARDPAPFDLLLMDMQMPDMDGYTAAAKLRELSCRTPIIALTAHAMAGDREKCQQAGCDDYATKPVERAALIQMCAKWTKRAVPGQAA